MECRDCPFEEKLDSMPKCPIVKMPDGTQCQCGGLRCAWWDEGVEQCCILSIAYRLTNINRGMAK